MKYGRFIQSGLQPIKNERGAVAALVALFLIVLLAMGAAAIDVGHGMVARNELQNASDAAALAGARALGVIYQGMSLGAQSSYVLTGGDQAAVVAQVQAAGVANVAAGVAVTVNGGDIQIGQWDAATKTFTPTTAVPNAVRVFTRRDGTANGPITTFLGSVIGISSLSVTAPATAALTPTGIIPAGAADAPFGIAELFFQAGNGCGSTIQFSPSIPGNPSTCAGWTVQEQNPFNNNNFVDMVNDMRIGEYESPAAQAGASTWNFGNGNLGAPAWTALYNLWQQRVSDSGSWTALMPVYAGSDCSPSGAQTITGFATVQVTYVGGPGDPANGANCVGSVPATGCIKGVVTCPAFNGTGGNGPNFGTFNTVSGLVE